MPPIRRNLDDEDDIPQNLLAKRMTLELSMSIAIIAAAEGPGAGVNVARWTRVPAW